MSLWQQPAARRAASPDGWPWRRRRLRRCRRCWSCGIGAAGFAVRHLRRHQRSRRPDLRGRARRPAATRSAMPASAAPRTLRSPCRPRSRHCSRRSRYAPATSPGARDDLAPEEFDPRPGRRPSCDGSSRCWAPAEPRARFARTRRAAAHSVAGAARLAAGRLAAAGHGPRRSSVDLDPPGHRRAGGAAWSCPGWRARPTIRTTRRGPGTGTGRGAHEHRSCSPARRSRPARSEARLDATVLPPAAMGDVLRATRARVADAIALIDGVFERVLPGLAQGDPVGAGAGRACLRVRPAWVPCGRPSCTPSGWSASGAIFEAYRDGALEADDEVAVLHGPAEVGFAAVTEALVNVRATLDAALAAEACLRPRRPRRSSPAARALHYRERTWDAILQRRSGCRAAAAARLAGRAAASIRSAWTPWSCSKRSRLVPGRPAAAAAAGFALRLDGRLGCPAHGVGGCARATSRSWTSCACAGSAWHRCRRWRCCGWLARREADRSGAVEPDRPRAARRRCASGMDSGAGPISTLAGRERPRRRRLRPLARGRGAAGVAGGGRRGDWRAAMLAELRASGGYAEFAARARAKAAGVSPRPGWMADPRPRPRSTWRPCWRHWPSGRAARRCGPTHLARPAGLCRPGTRWSARLLREQLNSCASCTDKNDGATVVAVGSLSPPTRHRVERDRWVEGLSTQRAGGGGTWFRLYPQPPFRAGYRQPVTIELSPPAGSLGAGPHDSGCASSRRSARTRVLRPAHAARLPTARAAAAVARCGCRPARPGPNGGFDHLDPADPTFVQAHAFACVRLALDVWERLSRPDRVPGISGASGTGWRSACSARATTMARSAGAGSSWAMTAHQTGRRMPFALNLDVVAHEVGHLIVYGTSSASRRTVCSIRSMPASTRSMADLAALLVTAQLATGRRGRARADPRQSLRRQRAEPAGRAVRDHADPDRVQQRRGWTSSCSAGATSTTCPSR